MEYHYSHLVDPSSYDNEGLCDGIPLRVHRNSDLEEMGTIRLRNDWNFFVGPLPITSGGSMGPIYNFTSVTMPECRPDRLELVSYMVELGFLNDDSLDTTKVPEDVALTGEMVYRRNEGIDKAMIKDRKSGEGQILANFAKEMMSIDPERASEVMKYLRRDLRVRHNGIKFKDFDDFLEYRVVEDSGSDFLIALSVFGMRLTIPREEQQTCFELTRPVWAAAILTNDVQSWDKEYKFTQMQDKTDMTIMTNGIWVLMKQHSIDIEEAKRRVLQKVKDFVAQYVITLEKNKTRQDLSLDSRRLIEAMQTLSDLQLNRIKNGWPSHIVQVQPCHLHGTHVNGAEGTHISGIETPDPLLMEHLLDLDHAVIHAPARYIQSLPSKCIRDKAVDALNVWLGVPEADIIQIKQIINILHNASLMLDDIQDSSALRRGKPSTHTIFGTAQTINSAGYQIIQAMNEVRKLNDPQCDDIFSEEMGNLYKGQSLDLFWTFECTCPSIEQFLKMVDCKTGGLFRMLAKLMIAKSSLTSTPELATLMTLIGRYFQIRDDYMNLTSSDYAKQKGLFEDLDEGKYTLALIHAMGTAPEEQERLLRNILAQRRILGKLPLDHKKLVLDHLELCGSMDFTVTALEKLHTAILKEIEKIDQEYGQQNTLLISLLSTLKV
ncbi:hypothetical protein V500_05515 [Pseudogymnoascus sp. VKM F-4518 (FW-2643)]|nr:hypothetical protein V500_05515 [Pseudogymnoascus sp. VKM F-4518 (FW-2643)]